MFQKWISFFFIGVVSISFLGCKKDECRPRLELVTADLDAEACYAVQVADGEELILDEKFCGSAEDLTKDLSRGTYAVRLTEEDGNILLDEVLDLGCSTTTLDLASGTMSTGTTSTGTSTTSDDSSSTGTCWGEIRYTNTTGRCIRLEMQTSQGGNLIDFCGELRTVPVPEGEVVTQISMLDRDRVDSVLNLGETIENVRCNLPEEHTIEVETRGIALGFAHSCVLRDYGVYCWGDNALGQTGQPASPTAQVDHLLVTDLEDGVTRLATSNQATCAVQNNEIRCFGSHLNGELGRGKDGLGLGSSEVQPVLGLPSGEVWEGLVGGANHFCALSQSNQVFCWGSWILGELHSTAIQIGLQGATGDVEVLTAGGNDSCVLTVNDELYCWGSNFYGSIRSEEEPFSNDVMASAEQVEIPGFLVGDTDKVALSDGTLCLSQESSDRTHCRGRTDRGQAGVGPGGLPIVLGFANQSAFDLVFGASSRGMDGGSHHFCARYGASARCWGRNTHGQLGIASSDSNAHPGGQTILGFNGPVLEVATGHLFSCARVGEQYDDSSTFFCWGDNSSRQLGSGSAAAFLDEPQIVNF